MTRQIDITNKIAYIPASENPLSADVGIIRGAERTYFYDVGSCQEAWEYIDKVKEKAVILSHFHPDHMKNIHRLDVSDIYVGENTAGYLREYKGNLHLVKEPVEIEDGLKIMPLPSCHAKGSLAMIVDDTYVFLGDGTYGAMKKGERQYNVQKLKELIDTLEGISADYVLLSHSIPFVKEKKVVLEELKAVYSKREKNVPYIKI